MRLELEGLSLLDFGSEDYERALRLQILVGPIKVFRRKLSDSNDWPVVFGVEVLTPDVRLFCRGGGIFALGTARETLTEALSALLDTLQHGDIGHTEYYGPGPVPHGYAVRMGL